MQECIFCKIISGELPSEKVYEDEEVLAFLNIRPASKGALLVVNKKHTPDFQSTPDEILGTFLPRIKQVATALLAATGASGYNLAVNNGAAAGQVIFHLHFHIIPRYSNDGLKLFEEHESEKKTQAELAEKIRQNIE